MKELAMIPLVFFGVLLLAAMYDEQEPAPQPVPAFQCHGECVLIPCQVCPDPLTPVDLAYCEALGDKFVWNGVERVPL